MSQLLSAAFEFNSTSLPRVAFLPGAWHRHRSRWWRDRRPCHFCAMLSGTLDTTVLMPKPCRKPLGVAWRPTIPDRPVDAPAAFPEIPHDDHPVRDIDSVGGDRRGLRDPAARVGEDAAEGADLLNCGFRGVYKVLALGGRQVFAMAASVVRAAWWFTPLQREEGLRSEALGCDVFLLFCPMKF